MHACVWKLMQMAVNCMIIPGLGCTLLNTSTCAYFVFKYSVSKVHIQVNTCVYVRIKTSRLCYSSAQWPIVPNFAPRWLVKILVLCENHNYPGFHKFRAPDTLQFFFQHGIFWWSHLQRAKNDFPHSTLTLYHRMILQCKSTQRTRQND